MRLIYTLAMTMSLLAPVAARSIENTLQITPCPEGEENNCDNNEPQGE